MQQAGAAGRSNHALSLLLLCCAVTMLAPGVPAAAAGGAKASAGAGFRWSPYGPPRGKDPGPRYWAGVAKQMAGRFPGAAPRGVWVVCEVDFGAGGCTLPFRGRARDPLIHFAWRWRDSIEAALELFDEQGVEVWLQVEPGHADVEELIAILLDRYGHHPSVIGIGVDAEWYKNAKQPALGQPVSDAEARAWARAVTSRNPNHRLFLKHWLREHMPPTERDGIVFINDGQDFSSLDALVKSFGAWGRAFAPAPVAFQYGYASDRSWWKTLSDAPGAIGERLFADIPNTEAVYWVDFTAHKVFRQR